MNDHSLFVRLLTVRINLTNDERESVIIQTHLTFDMIEAQTVVIKGFGIRTRIGGECVALQEKRELPL
jgi:hypothetical protein